VYLTLIPSSQSLFIHSILKEDQHFYVIWQKARAQLRY